MSCIDYEKLSNDDSDKKAIELIRIGVIESLLTSDINQPNHGIFFKKASTIEGYLKSARKYEASAYIALDLLVLEFNLLQSQPQKSDSKTGLLLLKEIWRYGNDEQTEIMRKKYLPKMPENCRIKFQEKACQILDEREKSTERQQKFYTWPLMRIDNEL